MVVKTCAGLMTFALVAALFVINDLIRGIRLRVNGIRRRPVLRGEPPATASSSFQTRGASTWLIDFGIHEGSAARTATNSSKVDGSGVRFNIFNASDAPRCPIQESARTAYPAAR